MQSQKVAKALLALAREVHSLNIPTQVIERVQHPTAPASPAPNPRLFSTKMPEWKELKDSFKAVRDRYTEIADTLKMVEHDPKRMDLDVALDHVLKSISGMQHASEQFGVYVGSARRRIGGHLSMEPRRRAASTNPFED